MSLPDVRWRIGNRNTTDEPQMILILFLFFILGDDKILRFPETLAQMVAT